MNNEKDKIAQRSGRFIGPYEYVLLESGDYTFAGPDGKILEGRIKEGEKLDWFGKFYRYGNEWKFNTDSLLNLDFGKYDLYNEECGKHPYNYITYFDKLCITPGTNKYNNFNFGYNEEVVKLFPEFFEYIPVSRFIIRGSKDYFCAFKDVILGRVKKFDAAHKSDEEWTKLCAWAEKLRKVAEEKFKQIEKVKEAGEYQKRKEELKSKTSEWYYKKNDEEVQAISLANGKPDKKFEKLSEEDWINLIKEDYHNIAFVPFKVATDAFMEKVKPHFMTSIIKKLDDIDVFAPDVKEQLASVEKSYNEALGMMKAKEIEFQEEKNRNARVVASNKKREEVEKTFGDMKF